MDNILKQAIDKKIIDETEHKLLLADLSKFSKIANIPSQYILTSMKEFCTDQEIRWIKNCGQSNLQGKNLAYIGQTNLQPVDSRMHSMGGAFIRNGLDAKVYTVQQILKMCKKYEEIVARILFIPNFFINKSEGGTLAPWEISDLLGVLLNRITGSTLTVIYISDFAKFTQEYGKSFADHVNMYYSKIK